jgi:hypothetical protein
MTKSAAEINVGTVQAKTESTLQRKLADLLSSSAVRQSKQSLPRQPISAEASNDNTSNVVLAPSSKFVMQKADTATSVNAMVRGKPLRHEYYISIFQHLQIPSTAQDAAQLLDVPSRLTSDVTQTVVFPTTTHSSAQTAASILREVLDSRPHVNAPSLSPMSKIAHDLSKSPEDSFEVFAEAVPQYLQSSFAPSTDGEQSRKPPVRSNLPLDAKNSPRLQVGHAPLDTRERAISSTLMAHRPVLDPPPGVSIAEHNDLPSKHSVQVMAESSVTTPQASNISSLLNLTQGSNYLPLQQPSSSSRALYRTPTIVPRLSPVIVLSEVMTSDCIAPTRSAPSRDPPSQLLPSDSKFKDLVLSLGSTSQPTPDASVEPLAVPIGPTNNRTHVPSRLHELHVRSHSSASTSPNLHASTSRSPSHPEASLMNPKTSDSHQADIRSPARISEYQASTFPRSYLSKSHERPTQNVSKPVPPTSAEPVLSSGNRSVSKTQDLSSRIRDPSGTNSTIYPNALQPNLHPHRTGSSTPTNVLALTTAQYNISSISSTIPSTSTDLSQATATRSTASAGQHHQASTYVSHSHSSSDPQHISTATRVPIFVSVPTPINAKDQQLMRSVSTESESILRTPSSLAMSRPPSRTASSPLPSVPQEHRKRKHVLEIFRTTTPFDSSPGEPVPPPPKAPQRDDLRPRSRSSAALTSGSNPFGVPSTTVKSKTFEPNVANAIPNTIHAPSNHTSSGPTVFTPFRLVTSNRHRTISSASLEAVDGTAVSWHNLTLAIRYLMFDTDLGEYCGRFTHSIHI